MSILTAPWFWVGLSLLVSAIAWAWFAARGSGEPPMLSGRGVGRAQETKHEHGEYVDDPYIR